LDVDGLPAYTAVLGLVLWIFLGGLANILAIATPIFLYAIVGVGLILSVAFWVVYPARRIWPTAADAAPRKKWVLSRRNLVSDDLMVALTIVAALILVAFLMPSSMFNSYDDFHTYLPRPIQMLQTGSLTGNPFNLLGIDSMGAQAFMQGFVLLQFPIDYINGFDGVFCFALCALLLIELGKRFDLGWPYIAAALLAFLTIPPYYVNVSALYSGSMIILALFIGVLVMTKRAFTESGRATWRYGVPIGVFLTSLLALKMTFAFFILGFSVALIGALYVFQPQRRRLTGLVVAAVGGGALAILPWIAMHASKFLSMIEAAGVHADTNAEPSSMGENVSVLFSGDPILFGSSFGAFLYVVILIAAVALFAIFLAARLRNEDRAELLPPLAALCVAAVVSYFAIALFTDPPAAVRYSCPVLIAVAPLAGLVLSRYSADVSRVLLSNAPLLRRLIVIGLTILAVQLTLIVTFADQLPKRWTRLTEHRTLTSYPFAQEYVDFNAFSLGPDAAAIAQEAQHLVPPGKTILAWIATPFHLDFSRNPVMTVADEALSNPWLDLPVEEDPELLRDRLKALGIRYVIWQRVFYGKKDEAVYTANLNSPFPLFRRTARYSLYTLRALSYLAKSDASIYDDGRLVVLDLGA